MKKILIASFILLFLAGCSFGKKATDFGTLYNNYIVAGVNNLDKFSEAIGYKRHESVAGAIKAGLQIPVLMSGAFQSEYDTKINGTDMSMILKDMNLSFESPINTGSLSAKRLALTSIMGDMYILFEDLADNGLFPTESRAIFAKYNNKWLSYTQKDINETIKGSNPDDILASTIAENISKMGLKDIEGYLTSYPIWKSTADLSMSGNLHAFAVDLDRDAVIGLVKKVTLDLSGSGISEESIKELKNNLDEFVFSGVLSFNPDDAEVMDLNLNISQSGVLIGRVLFSTSPSRTDISFDSVEDATKIALTLTKSDDRKDIKIVLTQNAVEAGTFVGYITRDGNTLRELSVEATVQGVSLSLKHTNQADGVFEGKLTLPVGNLTWNGKVSKTKLEAFSLKGVMPMGSIDMNLVPENGVLRGPLVIKSGSDELFRANIGLRAEKELFGLEVEVVNPEGGNPTLKTNLEVTYKETRFDDSILAPSPTEPLKNLIDELEKIVPPAYDTYSDEDTTLENLDTIDMDSQGVIPQDFDTSSYQQ